LLTDDMLEFKRLELQHQLDSRRTQAERNKLGQFATPTELATEILEYAKSLLIPDEPVRFLDPALGTGSFLSALLRTFPESCIESATGYEIDPYYGHKARDLWDAQPFKLHIADYTRAVPPTVEEQKTNLLICNPPYVRHHHLSSEEKQRLQSMAEKIAGIQLSELAGLYCYFLCIAHGWMAQNGLAAWLIPSEFMDVNYGRQIKQYLLHQVTLLRIHRFNPEEVQFKDALVSSAVVWFRKAKPPENHMVEFTYGGTMTKPQVSKYIYASILNHTFKWTQLPSTTLPVPIRPEHRQLRLSDLFFVKRGLVTGANDFFILSSEQIEKYQLPQEFLIPILPGPRFLLEKEIQADQAGNPVLEQKLFLLDCRLPEDEVMKYPSLEKYLQMGKEADIDKGYICNHRSPWYFQEERPPSRFLCTYMGRQGSTKNNPFRFILNHSRATVANVYLILYPKPALERALKDDSQLEYRLWKALNNITPEVLMKEGRVYGGGLYKLEPGELGNIPADEVLTVLPETFSKYNEQMRLF
jgi:adenine-specific DNA-methyltransferase